MKLTPEQLRQYAAAMIAFADGKPIQLHGCNGGPGWADLLPHVNPDWDFHRVQYRPKPEPAVRPWSKPDDVPGPVCWIRSNLDREYDTYLIGRIVPGGVWTMNASGNQCWEWERFDDGDMEYSIDRKTWHKCEVPE